MMILDFKYLGDFGESSLILHNDELYKLDLQADEKEAVEWLSSNVLRKIEDDNFFAAVPKDLSDFLVSTGIASPEITDSNGFKFNVDFPSYSQFLESHPEYKISFENKIFSSSYFANFSNSFDYKFTDEFEWIVECYFFNEHLVICNPWPMKSSRRPLIHAVSQAASTIYKMEINQIFPIRDIVLNKTISLDIAAKISFYIKAFILSEIIEKNDSSYSSSFKLINLRNMSVETHQLVMI